MPQSKEITVVDLREVRGEPRVDDVSLATALGMKRPTDVRRLITRNKKEIESYGILPHVALKPGNAEVARRGRPGSPSFLLNERQAFLVASLSDADRAPEVRSALIEAFMAYREAHCAPTLTVAQRRHANQLRFWKLRFAEAAGALDDLGADVLGIDMPTVLNFSKMMRAPVLAPARR